MLQKKKDNTAEEENKSTPNPVSLRIEKCDAEDLKENPEEINEKAKEPNEFCEIPCTFESIVNNNDNENTTKMTFSFKFPKELFNNYAKKLTLSFDLNK